MLLITISAALILAENTNGGYIYPRPSITFKLPKVEPNFEEVFTPKIVQEYTPKQTAEDLVSYFVQPQSDNLRQQITNLQNSNNLHESYADGLRVSSLANANLHNSLSNNLLSQRDIPTVSTLVSDLSIPKNHEYNVLLDAPTVIKPENSLNFDSLEHNIDTPNGQLQNNVELTTTQLVDNSDLNGIFNAQNVVPPKITKHIYFHVPPPEIDEPVVKYVPPKKKVYKIIFIKVPSQERRGIVQGNMFNQVGPVDERTIIYVLSKKPNQNQDAFLPKPVPSEHEVFFVKYNGNPDETVNQINDNLEQPINLIPIPRLQAGEINGKR